MLSQGKRSSYGCRVSQGARLVRCRVVLGPGFWRNPCNPYSASNRAKWRATRRCCRHEIKTTWLSRRIDVTLCYEYTFDMSISLTLTLTCRSVICLLTCLCSLNLDSARRIAILLYIPRQCFIVKYRYKYEQVQCYSDQTDMHIFGKSIEQTCCQPLRSAILAYVDTIGQTSRRRHAIMVITRTSRKTPALH